MTARSENNIMPILMYHSISDRAAPRFRRFAVPPALFADHMAYLLRHGYTPLTVTQAILARGASMPAKPLAITFDDGFADFHSAALPILARYSFPATLYVATGYINDTSRWLWREGEAKRPMLTWEQLADISARGIECGSHSQFHPPLDTLPAEKARQEIVESKRCLEDRLGKPVLSFAYPFGFHNALVRRLVREAGYTSACVVGYGMSTASSDPFALARLMIGADTSVEALAALVTGSRAQAPALAYLRARSAAWRCVRHGAAALRPHKQGVWVTE